MGRDVTHTNATIFSTAMLASQQQTELVVQRAESTEPGLSSDFVCLLH